MSPTRSHDDAMAEHYREHPDHAVEMLNSILEDGEPGELLVALRQMTKAFGGGAGSCGKGRVESDAALSNAVA